jgi:hypothetical protein
LLIIYSRKYFKKNNVNIPLIAINKEGSGAAEHSWLGLGSKL